MKADPCLWCAEVLGYTFQNPALLNEALTHGSSGQKPTYERLEFLGDRVLGLAVAEMLLEAYPEADEGEMGRRHAALVQGASLAEVARALGIAAHIQHGLPTPTTGLLADVVEALLGAMYVDGGWKPVRAAVRVLWAEALLRVDGRDAKTTLQEILQGRKLPTPAYDVVAEEGPDHLKQFVVKVVCALGEAEGRGPSKNEATKQAAAALLLQLKGVCDA